MLDGRLTRCVWADIGLYFRETPNLLRTALVGSTFFQSIYAPSLLPDRATGVLTARKKSLLTRPLRSLYWQTRSIYDLE